MLTIDPTMPFFWEEECHNRNFFLFMSEWQSVLSKGILPAKFQYISNNNIPVALVTIFKKNTLRVAYTNFPIGIDDSKENVELTEELAALVSICDIVKTDILYDGSFNSEIDILPRTIIENLSIWDLKNLSSSVGRNIKRAKKSNLRVRKNFDLSAHVIFDLYRSVIKRHKGTIRYGIKYFEELVRISSGSELINIYLAEKDGEDIAFICVLLHGSTGYYLHGAANLKYSKLRAMDLLFYQSISEFKSRGVEKFDMLASPFEQPNLVRYKEKWGGRTSAQKRILNYSNGIKGRLLKKIGF